MDLFVALAVFCLVTLFTPGPNNLMLMTSGLNFGVRRGMPHLLGVVFGFTLMVLIVGFGLGAIFEAWPLLYVALKYAGAAYLLFLAWQIAVSPAPGQSGGAAAGRPISFFQAVAFQWVNPKSWVMAVSSISTYAAVAQFPFNVLIIAGLFGLLGFASSGTWLGFAPAAASVERSACSSVFNVVMAMLLVGSLYPIFVDGLPGLSP